MAAVALARPPSDSGTNWERLREIIARESFRQGSFRLSSGKLSRFFFDMKKTMLHPEGANLIADAILDKLEDDVDGIGGLVMGAVPIVAVVCAKSYQRRPIKAFFVRKEAKDHGTGEQIDGYAEKGTRVVLVDDVTTTGGSVLMAVKAARQRGCAVDTVITVVDRCEGAEAALDAEGIRLIPLFKRTDFAN